MGYREMGAVMESRHIKDRTHFAALMAVAFHVRGDDGLCTASVETLAAEARLSERAVQGALKALSDGSGPKGYGVQVLTVVEEGGGRNRPTKYRLNLPWLRGENPAAPAPFEDINPAAPAQNPAAPAPEPVREPVRDEDDGVDARAREAVPLSSLWESGGSFPRHRAEIEDAAEAVGPAPTWTEGAAHQLAVTSLKAAGLLTPQLVAALDAATARLGAGAVVAALVVTRRGADPKSRYQARLSYLKSVIESLDDHATAVRYAADPRNAAAPVARGGGGPVGAPRGEAGGPSGGAQGRRNGGALAVRGAAGPSADAGGDGPRKSASDRRSEYGYDDAHRDVQRALADLLPSGPADRGRDNG